MALVTAIDAYIKIDPNDFDGMRVSMMVTVFDPAKSAYVGSGIHFHNAATATGATAIHALTCGCVSARFCPGFSMGQSA
jgi:hypothetical protein